MAAASPFLFFVGTTQYDFRNVVTALPDQSNPSRVVVTFNNGQTPLNLDATTYNALHLVALNATGNPPTGSAGGDLTGSYPNPTIATVAGTTPTAAGLTVLGAADAAAQRVAIGLSTAGGDLSGTLPSPTVAKVAGITPGATGLVLLAETSAAQAKLDLGITPANTPTIVALTDGASIAVNASLGSLFRVTLGGNRTLANPTSPVDGQFITFEFTQDGTGSRTLAFDTKYAATTTLALPTLSTAANAVDYVAFRYNLAKDKWYIQLRNLGGA